MNTLDGGWTRGQKVAVCCAAAVLAFAGTQPARAQVQIEFETQILEMSLTGGPLPMPLASDPQNNLGDSIGGYGFVNSQVTVTLSPQQQGVNTGRGQWAWTGRAFAFPRLPTGPEPLNSNGGPVPINPDDMDGESFFVESFFDVWFDITVTDVDPRPGRDFAGQPDGASVLLSSNGLTETDARYEAVFDKDAPNFGLLPPPEAYPWIGWFIVQIPLGGDINGNGEDDKIKFTLATFSDSDTNRNFLELGDGTVIHQGYLASFLQGAIVDESSDPPFTIGQLSPGTGLPDEDVFGGPFTMTINLLNPIVPEPATLALLVSGACGALFGMRKRGRRQTRTGRN